MAQRDAQHQDRPGGDRRRLPSMNPPQYAGFAFSFGGKNGQYCVSSDRSRLDLEMIRKFLAAAYWSKDIPWAAIRISIENSFCMGLYRQSGEQVGFARVATDYARIAFLADVFVLEKHRGKGLGKLLVTSVLEHPRLKHVTSWLLATRDAHGLYERFGFQRLNDMTKLMVLRRGGTNRTPASPPEKR